MQRTARNRLKAHFFNQDAFTCAKQLLGKKLVRRLNNGQVIKGVITEVEIYYGEEDLACHASKGRTARTEIMYAAGGHVYVYLIYGMYWLLNIVTGSEDHPQAILIRSLNNVTGPGRLGKLLQLDKSFYGEDLTQSQRLWLEDQPSISEKQIIASPRIGVGYSGQWADKPWRLFIE